MRSTFLLIVFVASFLGAMLWWTSRPNDSSLSWCPPGQKAVVVGSGRDVTGTVTVLYGCTSDLEAKL